MRKIGEDKIMFLQKHNSKIYLIAENEDSEVVLLTYKNREPCFIGNIAFEYKQVKDIAINFTHNLMGIVTKLNELHIYKISSRLQEMEVSSNSAEGIQILFDESGKYIYCFDSSSIINIWILSNNVWIKKKIEQTRFIGIFDKFSNDRYYFSKNEDFFDVVTPEGRVTFSMTKQDYDAGLKKEIFKKRKVSKEEPKEIKFKKYEDQDYVLKACNKVTNLLAGVKDRESIIDIWKNENDNYDYISSLNRHSGVVKSICFSKDGSILISGSVTNEIKVWNIFDDNFTIKQSINGENAVKKIMISDDNKTFISVDNKNILTIWKRHNTIHRAGKKKKRVCIDKYYNYSKVENFQYQFDSLEFNRKSLNIVIQDHSYILFDFLSEKFTSLDNIAIEINKDINDKKNAKITRLAKNASQGSIIKKQKISNRFQEEVSESNTVKTAEDLEIADEIAQFRENINKLSHSDSRKKTSSPIRRKTSEIIDIVVGLDFGTSTTKMAYRRISTDKVKPILFEHKIPNHENYFLPSIVVFNEDDKLLQGFDAVKYLDNVRPKNGIYNFKMLFVSELDKSLNNNENIKSMKESLEGEFSIRIYNKFHKNIFRYIVVSYLTHAMRKAKDKIIEEYPNRTLDISFNICIPVDYLNENNISEEFRKLLASAEFIERIHYGKHNNLEFIDLVYRNIVYDENNTRVFDIPETVAEIASYTTSPGLKKGLHAIIDFGAGTTDISIINIKNPKTENQEFDFYSSHILNYGFRRVDKLKKERKVNEIKEYIYFLWEESNIAWKEAYNDHLRNTIYWKGDKVQIFVSGGGANEKLVSQIFQHPRVNKTKWSLYPHLIKKIPTPENYMNKNIPFHRFAVAYGLTIPKPKLKIDDFVLPKDAPNDTPIQKVKEVYREHDERVPFRY